MSAPAVALAPTALTAATLTTAFVAAATLTTATQLSCQGQCGLSHPSKTSWRPTPSPVEPAAKAAVVRKAVVTRSDMRIEGKTAARSLVRAGHPNKAQTQPLGGRPIFNPETST